MGHQGYKLQLSIYVIDMLVLIWHFLSVCVLGTVPTAGFPMEINRHDLILPEASSVMKDKDIKTHTFT